MDEKNTNEGGGGQDSDATAGGDYTILFAGDPSTLSSRVNNLLRRGWRPQGGITVTSASESPEAPPDDTWAQAMFKPAPQAG